MLNNPRAKRIQFLLNQGTILLVILHFHKLWPLDFVLVETNTKTIFIHLYFSCLKSLISPQTKLLGMIRSLFQTSICGADRPKEQTLCYAKLFLKASFSISISIMVQLESGNCKGEQIRLGKPTKLIILGLFIIKYKYD